LRGKLGFWKRGRRRMSGGTDRLPRIWLRRRFLMVVSVIYPSRFDVSEDSTVDDFAFISGDYDTDGRGDDDALDTGYFHGRFKDTDCAAYCRLDSICLKIPGLERCIY